MGAFERGESMNYIYECTREASNSAEDGEGE